MNNPYAVSSSDRIVALAETSERAEFIRRTYLHLGGAVAALVLLEALLLNSVGPIIMQLLGRNSWGPLIVMVAFMAVSWLARSWAESNASPQLQYAGLGLYVVAQAVILAPLLMIANAVDPDGKLPLVAGMVTGVIFLGLTAITFISRADFSFLGRILWILGLAAIALILAGSVFGFSLGLWFSVALVALAAGYILYDTSNIMHHYRTTQHVAAALALFASVAVLFTQILRILIAMREE